MIRGRPGFANGVRGNPPVLLDTCGIGTSYLLDRISFKPTISNIGGVMNN